MEALRRSKLGIVEFLLQRKIVTQVLLNKHSVGQNCTLATILFKLVEIGNQEIIKKLIERGLKSGSNVVIEYLSVSVRSYQLEMFGDCKRKEFRCVHFAAMYGHSQLIIALWWTGFQLCSSQQCWNSTCWRMRVEPHTVDAGRSFWTRRYCQTSAEHRQLFAVYQQPKRDWIHRPTLCSLL